MKHIYLFLFLTISISAMEQEQVPEPKPTETITPEQQKEREDKKKEMVRASLRSSMQMPIMMHPRACKPKHIYFPDMKEEEGE